MKNDVMYSPRLHLTLALLFALMLAACSNDSESVPQPQPPTADSSIQQPVVTQLVTLPPRPTAPIATTPPLSFDILPYEGTWTLLLRYEINDGSLFDQIVYSTSVGVTIGLDGTIFGFGDFQPQFIDSRCAVVPTDANDLGFTVTGELHQQGESVQLDLALNPNAPEAEEAYKTRCQDPLNNTTIEGELRQAILWPTLRGANQMSFTFDLSSFTHRSEFQQEMAAITGNELDGTLNGEIFFGR